MEELTERAGRYNEAENAGRTVRIFRHGIPDRERIAIQNTLRNDQHPVGVLSGPDVAPTGDDRIGQQEESGDGVGIRPDLAGILICSEYHLWRKDAGAPAAPSLSGRVVQIIEQASRIGQRLHLGQVVMDGMEDGIQKVIQIIPGSARVAGDRNRRLVVQDRFCRSPVRIGSIQRLIAEPSRQPDGHNQKASQ